jgi:hypothetical protein
MTWTNALAFLFTVSVKKENFVALDLIRNIKGGSMVPRIGLPCHFYIK